MTTIHRDTFTVMDAMILSSIFLERVYVSHPCPIKHKTRFLTIELNAFSNRGHIYGHLNPLEN